jgi:hypothetical protein
MASRKDRAMDGGAGLSVGVGVAVGVAVAVGLLEAQAASISSAITDPARATRSKRRFMAVPPLWDGEVRRDSIHHHG